MQAHFQENRLSIGRINGVEIFAVKNDEGTVLVPIKPICTALCIDVDSQSQKIGDDEDLSSVAVLSTATKVMKRSEKIISTIKKNNIFLKIVAEKFGYMEHICYLCIVIDNKRTFTL